MNQLAIHSRTLENSTDLALLGWPVNLAIERITKFTLQDLPVLGRLDISFAHAVRLQSVADLLSEMGGPTSGTTSTTTLFEELRRLLGQVEAILGRGPVPGDMEAVGEIERRSSRNLRHLPGLDQRDFRRFLLKTKRLNELRFPLLGLAVFGVGMLWFRIHGDPGRKDRTWSEELQITALATVAGIIAMRLVAVGMFYTVNTARQKFLPAGSGIAAGCLVSGLMDYWTRA